MSVRISRFRVLVGVELRIPLPTRIATTEAELNCPNRSNVVNKRFGCNGSFRDLLTDWRGERKFSLICGGGVGGGGASC